MNLRPITLIGIVMSMVTGIALGITGYRSWLGPGAESGYAHAFDEVLSHIHANYVDEVDKDELVVSALRGMMQGLDDHSLFLDSRDYDDLQAETSGHFGGIGVEIGLSDDYFTVVAPMDGTPAARAGLKSGDRILAIDHKPLKGEKLIDVVSRLRGEPGSTVTLRIERDAQASNVDLTRATIELDSVAGRLLEPGYGYVRISQFQIGTGPAFEAALADLKRQSGGRLDGLVMDLRDNPGGVLQASVAVADTLLDDGLIVYTEGRLPSSKLRYRAAGGDLLHDAPVVILINRGTASAAEIVAGALQDHGRAVLIGATSYGKGSVQSVVPVSGHQAIKLTTAYYFTPNGRSIHHTGITPDLTRERGSRTSEDYDNALLSEALEVLKQRAPDSLHARL